MVSKSWIQKFPSKSNVPYPKTTLENNFRFGGQSCQTANRKILCAWPTKHKDVSLYHMHYSFI